MSHDAPRKRRHANRSGQQERFTTRHSGPNRPNFRDERMNQRAQEPDLPEGIDVNQLDQLVLQDLRVLSKENADAVAKHMIMAAELLEDEPSLALAHARAAKNRAGRVGVAREVNGIAAYRAGEWKEALSELRAARRIMGGPGLLAVMADCERGLGRPAKAIELFQSEEARQLDEASRIELALVAAGARLDLNQGDAALATLERLEPSKSKAGEVAARLSYAYADVLLSLDRKKEALEWFKVAEQQDVNGSTDVAERIAELSSVE